jgi:microcin C transport system substrate-binding protein
MMNPARATNRLFDDTDRRARLRRPAATGRSRTTSRLIALSAVALCAVATTAAPSAAQEAANVTTSHGLFLFGGLRYPANFQHFDYTNPDAPKGGDLVLAARTATFDSLNPYIVKGTPADGILQYLGQNLVYESLMVESGDEPASRYGLIAETVSVPQDKSWVEFTLRANARWWDGTPITPEDVIFSFDTLKAKGIPLFRNYYANVPKAEKTGPRKVRFSFSEKGNNELPFIVSELPVLSKSYWTGKAFDETTTTPPLSSGPYKIARVDVGRSIMYERNADYWGKDLPVNRGQFNFATIRFDYYRDSSVALEAFKAGKVDFRWENSSKNWATEYDIPAIQDGRMIKQVTHPENGAPYQAFLYNIRRPIFQDPKVREALSYAFDFEWTNKNVFYSQYARTRSYFEGTELAAKGLPTPAELKLLEPFKDQLDPRVLTQEYNPPATDGTETGLRKNLRTAVSLLGQAGWSIRDGKLVSNATGQQLAFQILLLNAADERVVAPFVNNLKLLGVDASFRIVDETQYVSRVNNFDYDMIISVLAQSLSPGNEQRNYWGSEAAARPGSNNYMGINSPVVDKLVDDVIFAADRQALITATHALDRVLQWGFYSIPELHPQGERIAYWNKFSRPETLPSHMSPGAPLNYLNAWWIDPKKSSTLSSKDAPASP